ncbi:DUF6527 family protein [Sphingomonas sp. HH69]
MSGFIALSPIISRSTHQLFFMCPGCEDWHGVNVDNDSRPRWGWNGSVDKPTFTPSILVRTGPAIDPTIVWEDGDPPSVCHSFVTDGRIQFLGDCTHSLAGQTVDIPPFDRKDEE